MLRGANGRPRSHAGDGASSARRRARDGNRSPSSSATLAHAVADQVGPPHVERVPERDHGPREIGSVVGGAQRLDRVAEAGQVKRDRPVGQIPADRQPSTPERVEATGHIGGELGPHRGVGDQLRMRAIGAGTLQARVAAVEHHVDRLRAVGDQSHAGGGAPELEPIGIEATGELLEHGLDPHRSGSSDARPPA
jgi:hypothetical protein